LVADRKEGTLVHYRLVDGRLAELLALARESLRARGLPVELPVIPKPPVSGCPCPQCQELSACCGLPGGNGLARRAG